MNLIKYTITIAIAVSFTTSSFLTAMIYKEPIVATVAYFTLPETVNASESIQNEPETALIVGPSVTDIKAKIAYYASKYKVSEALMMSNVSCETAGTFDPKIQSQVKYSFSDARRGIVFGEQEQSYGLAMIHLPDNLSVTKEQATDPDFALDFMAKAFSNGEYWRWYCIKNIN